MREALHTHPVCNDKGEVLFRMEVAMYRRLAWLIAAILMVGALPTASAQDTERCFPETGFCIVGRIREFWEQNGGLPVFGFPTAPQQEAQIEGKPFQVQWFERNRLELHPENARPYDVLLGRLGVDRLLQQDRDWFAFPKNTAQTGCQFFAETGQNVCGDILSSWRASGLEFDGKRGKSTAESLALFGLPISPLMAETLEGRSFQVQWFERARFELHPENAPPYHVLLGLLGNEVRAGAQAKPQVARDPCLDVPDPVSATIRPGKCGYMGEIFAFGILGFLPNEEVSYWFTDPAGKIDQSGTIKSGPLGMGEGNPRGDLYWITEPDEPLGIWSVVFKGTTSNYQATVSFKVKEGPAPALPCPDVPGPFSATIRPGKCVEEGTVIRMDVVGFLPNEKVVYSFTNPEGKLFAGSSTVTTNSSGEIHTWHDTIGDLPGMWAIVWDGISSRHEASVYFEVVSP